MHRPIQGKIKTCTLRRSASGGWTVSFSCEIHAYPQPVSEESIGIDVGLKHFAAFSDGRQIENPRFFKKGEKDLAKAQRKLSKLEKGTKERKKQGKAAARVHEKIRNQRRDLCHKEARKIVDQYQYICVEDLNVKKMIEGSPFAKGIADVSWNQFLQILSYKAEDAGRKIGFVDPAYTTQDCFNCGHREKKDLYREDARMSILRVSNIQGSQCCPKYFGPRTGWPGSNP
jgi:putative transposase